LNTFNWLAGEMLVTPPRRVAVLGLGLIGGSLLRRLDALGVDATGYDADPATRDAAGAVGSVAAAVTGTDLVVLAVPLPHAGALLDAVREAGYDGLVTDVTSVKAAPLRIAAERLPGARWVGGHPMAGREQSGFAASDPALFDGCAWVLGLEPETDLADWLRLAALVTAVGARVVPATAAEHDTAVARISHVPHVVAAALAAGAADPLPLALGAGSFRDGTRVAATRPALTAAMCGGNAPAVRAELDSLIGRLTDARRLLDEPDPVRALTPWLEPGHTVRAGWPPEPGKAEERLATRDALLALGRAGGWVTAVAPDGRSVTAVLPR
jgi:prephenate dehydrogenase